MRTVRLLALSGSLRAASNNTALLRALAQLAPSANVNANMDVDVDVRVEVYAGLGNLPLFNPDLESSDPPAVAALRERIIAAHGLVIASPEYAHGVSGVMKNALDWMVGNESFVNKPVMLLNASPRATLAQAALCETIQTMSARVIDAASMTVPILGSQLNAQGIVDHPETAVALRAALDIFVAAIAIHVTN